MTDSREDLIEYRGDPPVPVLAGVGLPVHAVIRMAQEVGAAALLATTPLKADELTAAREYYRSHGEEIDALLAADARAAGFFVERLDADPAASARVVRARDEPKVALEDLGAGEE